jgi:hypothetical protein
VETTDPAYEVGALAQWLLKLPPLGDQTFAVLSQHLGVSPDGVEYLELIAAVRSRLIRLATLAQSLDDNSFGQARRDEVTAATERLARVFHPRQQTSAWNGVVSQFVLPADAFALAMFSPFAKRVRPLRMITDHERVHALAKIDEAIEALQSAEDEPWWAREQVVGALERLRLTLQHLMFFGHDSAIEQILAVSAKVIAAGRARPSLKTVLGSTVAAVLVAVELFKLPVDVQEGARFYQDVYLEQVQPSLIAFEERLLLTGPQAEDDPMDTRAAID